MLRSLFLIVMGSLITGTVYLLIRNGAFLPVQITVASKPGLILVGKTHIGPYHQVLSSIQEVETWAKAENLGCTTSFGEYIDDPNVVEVARLRSFVGCVLERTPEVTLPEGFKVVTKEPGRYVESVFRGSPALGPYKVYGKAADFMKENQLTPRGAVIEQYRMEEDGSLTTLFWFPVQ